MGYLAKQANTKLAYCPIDIFHREEAANSAKMLVQGTAEGYAGTTQASTTGQVIPHQKNFQQQPSVGSSKGRSLASHRFVITVFLQRALLPMAVMTVREWVLHTLTTSLDGRKK